mmetsp:Transcript_4083/g.7835  ORF Transcript_4083/g.7835 Transcript_4083/m.7835 type:complete len:223 (+) Transcript_4083:2154-2822(+)
MQRDLSSSAQGVPPGIRPNMKTRLSIQTLPDVLSIAIIALTRNTDSISNQKCRVESHSEHTNHVHVIRFAFAQRLDEVGGSRPCDGSQVGNQILLRHANTRVADGQRLSIGIVFHLHLQLLRISQQLRLRHTQKSNLIQGIGRVRNKFPQENVLIGVERVDDDIQHFVYFGFVLEGVGSFRGRVGGGLGDHFLGGGVGGGFFGCHFVICHFDGVGESDSAIG